jgi:hypothetical protein
VGIAPGALVPKEKGMDGHAIGSFQATYVRAGDGAQAGFRVAGTSETLSAADLTTRVDAWVKATAKLPSDQLEVRIAWDHVTEEDPDESEGLEPEVPLEPPGGAWSADVFRGFLDRESPRMRDGDVLVVDLLSRTHLG